MQEVDKQKTIPIKLIDANQKLLGHFLELASNKDADYIEISPDGINLSIHHKLSRPGRQPTKKINQELIEYLKQKSGLNFNTISDEILTTSIKIEDGGVKHKLNLKFIKGRYNLTHVLIFLEDPIKLSSLKNLGFWGRNLNQICDSLVLGYGLNVIAGENKIAHQVIYSMAKLSAKESFKMVTLAERPSEVPIIKNNQIFSQPKTDFASKNLAKLILRMRPNILIVDSWHDNPALVDLIIRSAHNGSVVIAASHYQNPETIISELSSLVENNLINMLAESLNLVINLKVIESIDGHGKDFEPNQKNLAKLEKSFNLKSADSWADLATIGGFTYKNNPVFYTKQPNHCNQCGNEGFTHFTTVNQCLVIDEPIKRLIKAKDFDRSHITLRAINRGMLAIQYDALIKAMRGEITLSDALSVISN